MPWMSVQSSLERVLANYIAARSSPFRGGSAIHEAFDDATEELYRFDAVQRYPSLLVDYSVGKGKWALLPYISILDSRETTTPQRGFYCEFLFREDMSGVYLTLTQGTTEPGERLGRGVRREWLKRNAALVRAELPELAARFRLDDDIDLRATRSQGRAYGQSTIAYKLYERGAVPADEEIARDVELLVDAYEQFLEKKLRQTLVPRPAVAEEDAPFDRVAALEELIRAIDASGFIFEPWQIAAYVTALRTKPFVILAGVSGTGKSRLPALVARFTGGAYDLVPVRPDWTDSTEVLGHPNLDGRFQPGAVLRDVRRANEGADRFFTCILDEMNLARVEHYFAEFLSFIESRVPAAHGGFRSRALVGAALQQDDAPWADVYLSPNFGLVGTVNMDESSNAFSRKVLDRAFTIELSDVTLTAWLTRIGRNNGETQEERTAVWPVHAWYPRAIQLSDASFNTAELTRVVTVVNALQEVNGLLAQAQLQVGHRVCEEIAFFVTHAAEVQPSFRTASGESVDPLDLALSMKLLPRIAGGTNPVRRAILQILGWSVRGTPYREDRDALEPVERWTLEGRPGFLRGARFPRTAARLCLMWDRLTVDDVTSFWL
ncbi:MAG TPA: DUF3578 domain-containing protein [Thermoanaerobaculia bacterium]|jgi:hypothetical protein